MTESFEDAMVYARSIIADCDTPILDRLQRAHEAEIAELQGQYERKAIDLQKAHEREMEAVRDPQRIGGTLERGSFAYAIEQLREFRWQHATNDDDAIPYINGVAKAHEHEMEQLRRSRFREGYVAGQRSMDAEHYAVALRLKHLPLDEDSHGNLSQIARAIWHSDFGWTRGACEALRDELVRLLGGVHDEPEQTVASGGACDADCDCSNQQPQTVAYDVLGNERNKAMCALRNERDNMSDNMADNVSRIMYAIDARPKVCERACEAIADRLIHLLGGDEPLPNFSEPNLPKSEEIAKPESAGGCEVTITDELREWYRTTPYLGKGTFELCAIADRIDQQHNDLQKKLDEVTKEANRHRWEYCETYEASKTCDELEEKLDTIREALDG